jgi:hypothetical protein
LLKKMTIANLNVKGSIERDNMMKQVGGSICDMPLPGLDACERYCMNHCGTCGNDNDFKKGQDFYQTVAIV